MIFLKLSLSFTLISDMRLDSVVGLALNPYTASLFILTEGLIVGRIGSYISTRISEDVPLTKEDRLD